MIAAVIFCILLGLPCLVMPGGKPEQKAFRLSSMFSLSYGGQAEELCTEIEDLLPPQKRGRSFIDHRLPPSGLRASSAHLLGDPVRMRDWGSALRTVRFIHDQDGSSEAPPPPTAYTI